MKVLLFKCIRNKNSSRIIDTKLLELRGLTLNCHLLPAEKNPRYSTNILNSSSEELKLLCDCAGKKMSARTQSQNKLCLFLCVSLCNWGFLNNKKIFDK